MNARTVRWPEQSHGLLIHPGRDVGRTLALNVSLLLSYLGAAPPAAVLAPGGLAQVHPFRVHRPGRPS